MKRKIMVKAQIKRENKVKSVCIGNANHAGKFHEVLGCLEKAF